MTAHYDRALLLYQQSRYDLAEQELRQALADEPDNPFSHALLALCHCERNDHPAALREAEEAIHLGPDVSFTHYALAYTLYQCDRLREAEAAIEQALEQDPADADSYSMLASIHFDQWRWQDALEAAEQGLEMDAEHAGCTNLRAMALVKLGRRAEAGAVLGDALRRDPEDAATHANQGWALLEQRQPEKALEHFREALRLDPNSEWAREGIVEALKARHFLYRQLLRYFLWMGRLTGWARWGAVLGVWIVPQVVISHLPRALAPLGGLLFFCFLAFAFLTWTADPLFNLLLRLNRLGRLALTREQIWASNCVGGCLLVAVLALIGWAVSGSFLFATTALVSACLILPVAGVFQCPAGWRRFFMAGYTILLASLGFGANAFAALGPYLPPHVQAVSVILSVLMIGFFLLGIVASTWLCTLLMILQRRS
jgi:tetratricopeptide (TPR) repeat protein